MDPREDRASRHGVALMPGGNLLVGTGGKQAVYDYLDAKQGDYAFSFDLGVQNVIPASTRRLARNRSTRT